MSLSTTVCIPRVNNNISKQFIFRIFCELKVGFIEKIVEIPIKNDDLHKRVIIKIKWNDTEVSKIIRDRFESGKNVKIMYSEPSYWICVVNNNVYRNYSNVYVPPANSPETEMIRTHDAKW